MSDPSVFNEDYYLRGKESGLSNYENYRWLGDVTLTYAIYLRRHLGIQEGDKVLEIGCARGYLVKALRMMKIEATGQDVSEWAIANCDPDVVGFVSTVLETNSREYDYVIGKDTLEHIPIQVLQSLIPRLCYATKKTLLFIVPLTSEKGGRFLRQEDEMDQTHIVRFTLHDWLLFLAPLASEFTVHGSYHLPGVKPASTEVPQSCGFLTLERV